MKAIYVFRRIDGVEQRLGIYLFRQRQLNKDAIDVVAVVETVNQVEHLLGRDSVGRRDEVAVETEFGASLHFAADVDLRGGHVADENRCQSRSNAMAGQSTH